MSEFSRNFKEKWEDAGKKLQLLKNGLCFLLQSIEHFKCSENNKYDIEKELKYSPDTK